MSAEIAEPAGLDLQHYWTIAEHDLEIQNPITARKLRLLDTYCDLQDGARVLDVGCGKGWLLRSWAESYAIFGTGLDINPNFIDFARHQVPVRTIGGKLEFIEGPALDFVPERGACDITLCLGASFALGGFVQAVDWMVSATRPKGTVVIGDMTTIHVPPYTEHEPHPLDIAGAIAAMERHGLTVTALISASQDDFERYASHHRHAVQAWVDANPNDPERVRLFARSQADWDYYLKTIRPYLGWTIYVGRKAGA